jgi:hypothetical protein
MSCYAFVPDRIKLDHEMALERPIKDGHRLPGTILRLLASDCLTVFVLLIPTGIRAHAHHGYDKPKYDETEFSHYLLLAALS